MSTNSVQPLQLSDKLGHTPLHLAVMNKNKASLNVVKYLISKNDVALQKSDVNGDLPLHLAGKVGVSSDIIEFIAISYPAALHVKNKDGLHPVEVIINSHNDGYKDVCRWMAMIRLDETNHIVQVAGRSA